MDDDRSLYSVRVRCIPHTRSFAGVTSIEGHAAKVLANRWMEVVINDSTVVSHPLSGQISWQAAWDNERIEIDIHYPSGWTPIAKWSEMTDLVPNQ